jgi:hypothetical protein
MGRWIAGKEESGQNALPLSGKVRLEGGDGGGYTAEYQLDILADFDSKLQTPHANVPN